MLLPSNADVHSHGSAAAAKPSCDHDPAARPSNAKTSASLAPSEQQPQIESGNDAGYRPGEKLQPQRIDELTHQPTIACKQHERKHRKQQLQA